jgi:septum formation protein
MHLILASTSRYRAELLERLGIHFSAAAPEVDETRQPDETAHALVERLSLAKARAVAVSSADALVIGSDQVAISGGEILGKPGTVERAVAQLQQLSGQKVQFLTGLALLNTRTGSEHVRLVSTPVTFRQLQQHQIENYVHREMPLDCAGAFKSEGLGIALFEQIGGTDPTALIGLPLIELCTLLQLEGYDVLVDR